MNYEDRYIAFIDILGFKSIIKKSESKMRKSNILKKL